MTHQMNLKPVKLHDETNAIRLCLASLEEDARAQGFEQSAAYLKLAQLFVDEKFCKKD